MIAHTAAARCNELQHRESRQRRQRPHLGGTRTTTGWTSANLARQSIRLARDVVAIELPVMTEAMEHQRPLWSGTGVERTVEAVRGEVTPLTTDRPPPRHCTNRGTHRCRRGLNP